MAIQQLDLRNFTVFRRAKFDFSPGINALIGENGTGKSHTLKLLYAIEKAGWRASRTRRVPGGRSLLPITLNTDIAGVFRLDPSDLSPLCHRPVGREPTVVNIRRDEDKSLSFRIGKFGVRILKNESGGGERPVFLPTRELLSVFPGFAEAIRNRELEFDDTYPDLAEAVGLASLKGEAAHSSKALLALVGKALGGRELILDGRFHVKFNASGETFEAHMVAEGLRKVATLARLIRNGRIAAGTVLFWDEPEANLNPVLLRKVVAVLLALAKGGVQIFLASHDYLLTQHLSLHAEHPEADTPPMRFFSLVPTKAGEVTVESDDTLVGIKDNPILREHARQYDLEVAAIDRENARRT